jgi:hypothetical protein
MSGSHCHTLHTQWTALIGTSVARLLGRGTHRYRMVASVVEPPVLPDQDLLLKLQDPDPRV